MKTVGIYVRVSTTEQAEEGYSIEQQKDKLSKFCEIKDWNVKDIYVDAGFTGSNIKRPGMEKLISDIENKNIDTVLVYKLDRLSRSQKDTLFLIEDVFIKNNIDFISLNENFDTSTPFGKAMIGILSVFAQLEREQIKERMHMGKVGRAKSGKAMGWAKVPFGYDYDSDSGNYLINQVQSMVVKRIFDDYNAGISITKLRDYLNEEGHIGKNVNWSLRTLRCTLDNVVYAGKINFKNEVYEGNHPEIISYDYYKNTQKELKKRQIESYKKHNNPRPFQTKYLLSGLIKCGYCGARFEVGLGNIRKDGTRTIKYHCYSTKSKKRSITNKRSENCIARPYLLEEIEKGVLSQLEFFRLNPSFFSNSFSVTQDYKEEIKILKKSVNHIETKLSKLTDLYLIDSISLESLKNKTLELQTEKDNLVNKINTIKNYDNQNSVLEATETLQSYKNSVYDLSYDEQKILVRSLIKEIQIKAEEIKLIWNAEIES